MVVLHMVLQIFQAEIGGLQEQVGYKSGATK